MITHTVCFEKKIKKLFNISFIIVETDQTLEKEIIYSEPTFIERNAHNTVR